jgi:predicted small lipoprotein YifL
MARISAVLIVALALAVGGCGVKGSLEPPGGPQPQKNDPFVLDPLI